MVRRIHRLLANGREHIGHTFAVIDIHLAPIGFDENFFGVGGRSDVGLRRNNRGSIDITGRVFIAG